MRRGIIACAGAIALVVMLGSTAVASGAPQDRATQAKTTGPERAFVLPSTTSVARPGRILLTGTIADYGEVVTTNAKGTPTSKGAYSELELRKGAILVDIATLDQAITRALSHAKFDFATCSVSVSTSGTIRFVAGTKAYAGISGSFTMSGSLAEITPRTKSGTCTTKISAPPLATFVEFTGSGTVTLP